MKHNNWYYYDSITNALQLTENAPKKAIESYNMLFSNKDDILREDFMPSYMPVINEAIHILSNDTFAAELFDIDLNQKEKYMLTYKIHFENEYKIVYEYHPEDRDEYGLISIDKNSKEIKIEKRAYDDEVHDAFFSNMMFSKIRKFIEKNDYNESGMIAWY